MVETLRTPRPDSPKYIGMRISADDYLLLEDDGFKYQIINGVCVMSPSPTRRHQALLREMCFQIETFLRRSKIGEIIPDIDVRLAADLLYRPDLVFVRSGRIAKGADHVRLVPDLVIEILSPGSEAMDLRTKYQDYQKAGVEEYWIVSIEPDVSVQMNALIHGAYGTVTQSGVLAGFALDLSSLRNVARA